ncbi:unnamed protein product [Calypogeia fissa]
MVEGKRPVAHYYVAKSHRHGIHFPVLVEDKSKIDRWKYGTAQLIWSFMQGTLRKHKAEKALYGSHAHGG